MESVTRVQANGEQRLPMELRLRTSQRQVGMMTTGTHDDHFPRQIVTIRRDPQSGQHGPETADAITFHMDQ